MTLWVIKVGTSLLRGTNERSTAEIIDGYSACIAKSKSKGDQVILVTSGAVGLGCLRLGIKKRPDDLASLQAVAAVGQGHLMGLYEKSFSSHGYNVAQVLLTRAELGTRMSYRNASLTFKKLLAMNVIPIVNENDTISAEELRYGDNDTLSALVASAVSADQLILLTDVDRLYSKNPKTNAEAKPITEVHHSTEIESLEKVDKQKGEWGTGGIQTKLSAAKIATASGITVQLADGRDPTQLAELLNGSRGGTVFYPSPKPLGSLKSWLAHAIKPLGIIYLDKGASLAIKERGASLLLVGITKVSGNFSANQPVKILGLEHTEVARGLSSLSSEDLRNALKMNISSEKSQVVVHRDVLVLTGQLKT